MIGEQDFIGARIDLLGRLTNLRIATGFGPVVVFTTSRPTFVAFASIKRPEGTTWPSGNVQIGRFNVSDQADNWSTTFLFGQSGLPREVVVYVGTGFASETNLMLQPAMIGPAQTFNFEVISGWGGGAVTTGVEVSAYGWTR